MSSLQENALAAKHVGALAVNVVMGSRVVRSMGDQLRPLERVDLSNPVLLADMHKHAHVFGNGKPGPLHGFFLREEERGLPGLEPTHRPQTITEALRHPHDRVQRAPVEVQLSENVDAAVHSLTVGNQAVDSSDSHNHATHVA